MIWNHNRIVSLYVLQSCIVTGSVAVSTVSMLDEDVTKLWHLRLGHMGECDMIELSQRGLPNGLKMDNLEFSKHCVFGKHKRVK